MSDKDNTVDIFSKRSLSEVEKEKEERRQGSKDLMLDHLRNIMAEVESGVVTGLGIISTTRTGYFDPILYLEDTDSALKINYLSDKLREYAIGHLNVAEMMGMDESDLEV